MSQAVLEFPLSPCAAPTLTQRLLRSGGGALSDAELLEVLLGPQAGGRELAQALFEGGSSFSDLIALDPHDLDALGAQPETQARLVAALDFALRMARSRMPRRDLLDRPDAVASYLNLRYGLQDQEVMGALYLDVRNRLIADSEVFRGTLSRSAVEPRPILKECLSRSASSFILFHTHPSGDPSPSAEDLTFTRRMAEAGKLVGVRLVDHLILGGAGRWMSMRRHGAW